MTGKEARAAISGPLRFGDARQIKAAAFLASLTAQSEGTGPAVCCVQCQDPEKPFRRHPALGCVLCAECAAAVDVWLGKETP